MKKYLVVSALGTDRPGIANHLATLAAENNCNIVDSMMVALGSEFAVTMMISGSWNAIAKFEDAVPGLEKKLELSTIIKRTEIPENRTNLLPYSVQVVSMDEPGIIKEISTFFSSQQINIENLQTETYNAPHTGAPMLVINMTVNVPATMHISDLRDRFLLFCDDINLDANMEPVKGNN
ncbi:MAG: glycine cleavage system protein R [Gammaproteobacteria bacterium]|nr:MAG: glycine cleavage system protein R [Gammaproteobacteria bacterium]